MPVLAVIPARLGSTRLHNKPLQLLAGEPLVVRVAEHVLEMRIAERVVVATDSPGVAAAVRQAALDVVLTAPTHLSGTDRVAEVAGRPEYADCDLILNVQGDEPFLPAEAATGALERLGQGDEVGTASVPLSFDAAASTARVKVVTDLAGRALYFSRARIPWRAGGAEGAEGAAGAAGAEEVKRVGTPYWQHLGVYAFTRPVLLRWASLRPTPLEQVERLEQLRALEHGFRIGVARLAHAAPPGVDTPEDLREAEAYWHRIHEGVR